MPSEVELGEVFRLGVVADDGGVVDEVGARLADSWLAVSRFRDVLELMGRSLAVQSSARTLLYAGHAEFELGALTAALQYFEQALPMLREVGDWAGEAATLNSIGLVHDWRGAEALRYFERALAITRKVGDRAGEAATLTNIGFVQEKINHGAQALRCFERALAITREVGDRAGEAATLKSIGMMFERRRDAAQAVRYYEHALPILQEMGDRAGEATTRYRIAMRYLATGRLADAVAQLEVVVALDAAAQRPDLADDTQMLNFVRAQLAAEVAATDDSAGPAAER